MFDIDVLFRFKWLQPPTVIHNSHDEDLDQLVDAQRRYGGKAEWNREIKRHFTEINGKLNVHQLIFVHLCHENSVDLTASFLVLS